MDIQYIAAFIFKINVLFDPVSATKEEKINECSGKI